MTASPTAPTSLFRARDAFDEFLAAHRLASALLPAYRLRALLERANYLPSAALVQPESVLKSPAIDLKDRQIARLQEAIAAPISDTLRQRAKEWEVSVITIADAAYPANLVALPNSPPLLFVRGTLLPNDTLAVAMVGSRRATIYGQAQAERFAEAFAQNGITVVSGGAAGIDTAAHKGALKAGGRTVAVLGCGVDVTYPAENKALFAQIVASGGAIISEFPVETTPEPWRFPTRNRIIAGMTRLTLVLESPVDSGALITARDAADYGRDVWAVPGVVDSGRSRGCHRLIQDGAGLADCPEDVMNALGMSVSPDNDSVPIPPRPRPVRVSKSPSTLPLDGAAEPRSTSARRSVPAPAVPGPEPIAAVPVPLPANLSHDEEQLFGQLDMTPRHLDILTDASGLSAPQAAVAVTLLEMKSLIVRFPGNLFARRSV